MFAFVKFYAPLVLTGLNSYRSKMEKKAFSAVTSNSYFCDIKIAFDSSKPFVFLLGYFDRWTVKIIWFACN